MPAVPGWHSIELFKHIDQHTYFDRQTYLDIFYSLEIMKEKANIIWHDCLECIYKNMSGFGDSCRFQSHSPCTPYMTTGRSENSMNGYVLEKMNFLVVDNNKYARASVKAILHTLGARNILEAADGSDALQKLYCFPADIIICDWNIPPCDGLDFVRLVRTAKDSPVPSAAIVMLSEHTQMHHVVEARDAGVHEFLGKPISTRGLRSKIRSIIERPRPFIRTITYFGPDRRHHQLEWKGKERRSINPTSVGSPAFIPPSSATPEKTTKEEKSSQTEINALLK